MSFFRTLCSKLAFLDPANGKDCGAIATLKNGVISIALTNPGAGYTVAPQFAAGPIGPTGHTGPPGEPECDCDWCMKFGFHPGPGEEWDETELEQ